MNIELILSIIVVGIGATIVMDIWAFFLKKVFAIPALNYCLVGRWIEHMPSGRFTHQTIAQADPKPLECHVGWAFHYGVGIVFSKSPILFLHCPKIHAFLLKKIG